MNLLAFVVLVYRISPTGVAMSLMLALRLSPALLLGPIAGAVVDRFDRKKAMITADLVRAGFFFLLPFIKSLPGAYGVAFITACAGQFFVPARAALLPRLLGEPRDLTTANSILSATFNLSLLGGSSLGSLVLAITSPTAVFYFNAATFLASAASILAIRRGGRAESDGDTPPGRAPLGGIVGDVRKGLALIAGSRTMAVSLTAYAVNSLGVGAVNSILVILVTRAFMRPEQQVGYLVSAEAIGALLGAALVSLTSGLSAVRLAMAGGLIGSGISHTLFAGAPSFNAALGIYVLAGTFDGAIEVAYPTILQVSSPESYMARVFSFSDTARNAAQLLGMVAAGPLTDWAGPRLTVFLAAFLMLAAGAGLTAATGRSRTASGSGRRTGCPPARTGGGPPG